MSPSTVAAEGLLFMPNKMSRCIPPQVMGGIVIHRVTVLVSFSCFFISVVFLG